MTDDAPKSLVSDASTYVEMCVQDMQEAGVAPGMVCLALARHLRQQAALLVDDAVEAREFLLAALLGLPK